ncbi:MAG: cytochrome P450 [Wenzhouxiangellaceae bacterium]
MSSAKQTEAVPGLFTEGFKKNPYPTLKYLRENAPVYKSEYGIWIATRYEDVIKIIKDKRFKRDFDASTSDVYGEEALNDFTTNIMRHWIVNQSGPFHISLRRHMTKAINKATENLEPRIVAIAERLVKKGLEQGHFDLVADLTFPMTATVICEMLGVPQRHRPMFVEKSIFPSPGLLDVIPVPAHEHQIITKRARVVMAYLEKLCDHKLKVPGDDFTSVMLALSQEDPELTRECVVANMFFMFFAGHQSTQNLMSNCFHTLYSHPRQLELLKNNPDLIDNAAEELVRYDTSVQTGHLHYAEEDIDIDGVVISKGDAIMPILGAANRDPEINEDPEVFNILREKPKHISFNAGIHFCVGARLAMLELKIAMRTLLREMPDLQLINPQGVKWIPTYTLRGIKSLPVHW